MATPCEETFAGLSNAVPELSYRPEAPLDWLRATTGWGHAKYGHDCAADGTRNSVSEIRLARLKVCAHPPPDSSEPALLITKVRCTPDVRVKAILTVKLVVLRERVKTSKISSP